MSIERRPSHRVANRGRNRGLLALGAALVMAGGATLVNAGDAVPDDPDPGITLSACGTLEVDDASGCFIFVTHNGGEYTMETTGPFDAGDSVCVQGTLFLECPSTCGPIDGCIQDNTIQAAQPFSGCGEIQPGPQSCLMLAVPDGEGLFITTGAGGFSLGDQVFVTGVIVPDSQACWPVVGTGLDVFSIDPCRPGDASRNGLVDVEDILMVLATWGPCAGCRTDLNHNGWVDVGDLLLVLANWGA
ncbi:MAG: hypothetical protein ACYTG1_10385 [Planctomycetota bacterium]|jgi:hypothetical protein